MTSFKFPENLVENLLKEKAIAVEALTRDQLAEALRQALLSGDFIRQVRASDNAQNVIYIPYAREQELESRIRRLELALKENQIEDPDKALYDSNTLSVNHQPKTT